MQLTLEVTRLVYRFMRQVDPTGVDRVSLAYLRFAAENRFSTTLPVRAMVRGIGMSGIWSPSCSQELFDILLQGHRHAWGRMIRLLPKGLASTLLNMNGTRDLLLYSSHQGIETRSLWLNLRFHRIKPVFFLHDLIPVTHPQFCRDGESIKHTERLRAMRNCVGLITNSQHTALEWQDWLNAQTNRGAGSPSVKTAMLGIDYAMKNLAKSPYFFPANTDYHDQSTTKHSDQSYFVSLGTVEPRKNHRLLLEVWRNMLQTLPFEDVPHLRVIGRSGWDCQEIETQMLDQLWHRGKIQWLRDCSDDELARQLSSARALLFPSHTEGFGLPLAEALSAGLPAIASDLPVFREFAGDVPDYLPSHDVAGWTQAVIRYAKPAHDHRMAQLRKISVWTAPSWDAHFAEVVPWLQTLWEQHCAPALGKPADRD